MNIWKISCVVLMILAVFLCFSLYTKYNPQYDIGGVKVSKTTLDDISEEFDSKTFSLCSTDTKSCIKIGRLGDDGGEN